MFDQLASVTPRRPLSVLSNVRSDNGVSPTSVLEKDVQEGGDVVVGAMIHKVVQTNPGNIQPHLNVLFYPARDEHAKGNEGMFIEECKHAVDKVSNLVFILALVQAINDDEEWMACQ